jgi:hypothetical protein
MTVVDAPGDAAHGMIALLTRVRELVSFGDRLEAIVELEARLNEAQKGINADSRRRREQNRIAITLLPMVISLLKDRRNSTGEIISVLDRLLDSLQESITLASRVNIPRIEGARRLRNKQSLQASFLRRIKIRVRVVRNALLRLFGFPAIPVPLKCYEAQALQEVSVATNNVTHAYINALSSSSARSFS